MKIEKVIDCLNKSMEKKRLENNNQSKAHFTYLQNRQKQIGNYYKLKSEVSYYNNGNNSTVVNIERVEQINDNYDSVIEALQQEIVELLFDKVTNFELYKEFVEGTYGTK